MADSGRGYLYSRIRNPNSDELARGGGRAGGRRGRPLLCLGHGGDRRRARPAGSRPAPAWSRPRQLYGQMYAVLRRRGDSDLLRHHRPRRHRPRARRRPALLYVETIANPQIDVADLPALGRDRPGRRGGHAGRQHRRDTAGLPAARARRRPGRPLGHQVPQRPLRRARRGRRRDCRADARRSPPGRWTRARRSRPTPPTWCGGGCARSTCGSSGPRRTPLAIARMLDRHPSVEPGCATPGSEHDRAYAVALRVLTHTGRLAVVRRRRGRTRGRARSWTPAGCACGRPAWAASRPPSRTRPPPATASSSEAELRGRRTDPGHAAAVGRDRGRRRSGGRPGRGAARVIAAHRSRVSAWWLLGPGLLFGFSFLAAVI